MTACIHVALVLFYTVFVTWQRPYRSKSTNVVYIILTFFLSFSVILLLAVKVMREFELYELDEETYFLVFYSLGGTFIGVIVLVLLISICLRKQWPIDRNLITGKEKAIQQLAIAHHLYKQQKKSKLTTIRQIMRRNEINKRTKA